MAAWLAAPVCVVCLVMAVSDSLAVARCSCGTRLHMDIIVQQRSRTGHDKASQECERTSWLPVCLPVCLLTVCAETNGWVGE